LATEKEALSVQLLAWDGTQKELKARLLAAQETHEKEVAQVEKKFEKMHQSMSFAVYLSG
jgi:hypothetical protein